jgi:hypothetical protein
LDSIGQPKDWKTGESSNELACLPTIRRKFAWLAFWIFATRVLPIRWKLTFRPTSKHHPIPSDGD